MLASDYLVFIAEINPYSLFKFIIFSQHAPDFLEIAFVREVGMCVRGVGR